MAEKDYAYAVGRIRALETKLLPEILIDRLMNSAGVYEAMQVLVETDYGVSGHENDYEIPIEEELVRVYQLLQQLAPEARVLEVFRFKWDLHNLKLLMAAGGLKKPSRLGNFSWEQLTEILEREDLVQLPEEFHELLRKPVEDREQTVAELDKAYYRYGRRLLEDGSELLTRYWWSRLDLTNLRIFVRLRNAGGTHEELKLYLVEPGVISHADWIEQFDLPWESVAVWLNNKPYHSILREGSQILKELSILEREIENFLLEILSEAKRVSLGIEPLVAYLAAKETEAVNVRLIMAGKANRLPVETIRRRLRHGYV